jgi:hypothetical protein
MPRSCARTRSDAAVPGPHVAATRNIDAPTVVAAARLCGARGERKQEEHEEHGTEKRRKDQTRSFIPLTLMLFAAALLAVPAAFAKGSHHRTVRVGGVCTQQSTSKLKLSREHRGIEVELEVDQNRNAVPWKVTLRRNGHRVASLRALTHAPSGSFEVRRVIADRPGADRISARATRASGETCTASSRAPKAAAGANDDGAGHDVGDDHGHDG